MLIREFDEGNTNTRKLAALSDFLSGRAKDQNAKMQISKAAFINAAKSLGININEQTLGVHVRLTTMSLHNHAPVTIENYFDAVDKELESGRWNGIYVSTDNVESLVKMEQRYSRWIRYYPNLLRLPKEIIGNDNEWAWEYDMFFHKRFWQESFMEAMTLARCGGLVCRDSNFSNAAIVFSDTIKQVIRVGN